MFTKFPHASLRFAALAVALLAAGCEKKDGNIAWWQGEQERIELSHQLALKEFRYEQLGSSDLPELERLRRANQATAASLKSLKQQQVALNGEFEDLQGNLEDFHEATIQNQRNRAIGRSFPELVSLSGRTYRGVTVASIDDAGVAIHHIDGTARLRYQDLDAKQQLFFGLEAEPALAAVERESQNAAAYERWIDDQMVALGEKNDETAKLNQRNAAIAKANRSSVAARQVVAANTRALAKPASSVGSGSSRYYSGYHSYRSYRPTYYRYVYYTPNYYRPAFPRSCYGSTSRYYTPVVIQHRTSFANTTIPSVP
ncbi:MAG: hypothetical protein ABIS50_00710 [Luteolibacter sp.]|uniref:hypothetical protein n=1 Tax=Luteolibacter sp. TaxID=1962973 RepID=UPI003262DCC9